MYATSLPATSTTTKNYTARLPLLSPAASVVVTVVVIVGPSSPPSRFAFFLMSHFLFSYKVLGNSSRVRTTTTTTLFLLHLIQRYTRSNPSTTNTTLSSCSLSLVSQLKFHSLAKKRSLGLHNFILVFLHAHAVVVVGI